MKICSVEGCEKKVQARGWCNTHYWRWNQFGDALYEGPRNMATRIIKTAALIGKGHYETGLPCLRGHIAKRKSSGMCVECCKLLCRDKYRKDPTRQLAASARWRAKNIDYHNDLNRAWSKKNRDRKNEHRAKRRALEKCALPAWADRKAISGIYKRARELGMVVDHIVPLQHELVCGLHVENNLQLLSAEANKAKHNKYDATGTPV